MTDLRNIRDTKAIFKHYGFYSEDNWDQPFFKPFKDVTDAQKSFIAPVGITIVMPLHLMRKAIELSTDLLRCLVRIVSFQWDSDLIGKLKDIGRQLFYLVEFVIKTALALLLNTALLVTRSIATFCHLIVQEPSLAFEKTKNSSEWKNSTDRLYEGIDHISTPLSSFSELSQLLAAPLMTLIDGLEDFLTQGVDFTSSLTLRNLFLEYYDMSNYFLMLRKIVEITVHLLVMTPTYIITSSVESLSIVTRLFSTLLSYMELDYQNDGIPLAPV